MYKIKTLNKIAATGLSQFPANEYAVSDQMTTPDAILLRSHQMTIEDVHPSVIAIGRAGAGVNNIPIAALTARGIPVFNTPGANANAVRELVIAGMLLASRNLHHALRYVQQIPPNQPNLEKEIESRKKEFVGYELMGKTLGIIGLGSIGVKVANAAIGLGMRVIGYDPTINIARAWELSSDVQQAAHLNELYAQADFISLHIPLLPTTKNMIDSASFSAMKKGVVLMNFARDGIIDQPALIAAISHKTVSNYVSDFPANDMLDMPEVISLPHLGASTQEAEENCAVMIVKQVRDYLEHGIIQHAVNFPTVQALPRTGSRLVIVNANVPNMVAQVSSILAAHKINISGLINQSRDQIAVTLIDLENNIAPGLLSAVEQIAGIIQVRLLTPN